MSKDLIVQDIQNSRDGFLAANTTNGMNFDEESGFAIQALTGNEYAIGIAMKNRQSVVNAIVNVAAIGISLNPARKQAYLVPRDGKICLDISYMGLMDLAMSTGSIKWAQAGVVYEQDRFELNGFDRAPNHKFNVFSKDRGAIVGAYVVVKTCDGDYLTHTMEITEIYDIRNRSAGWKAGKSTPWKTDETEMIKKTVVKQAYKYWPKTERLETAIHHLNTDGEQGVQLSEHPISSFDSVDACNKISEAKDLPELEALWTKYGAELTKLKDRGGYVLVRNAFKEKKLELDNVTTVDAK